MLICEIHCSLKESEARQLIFEILSKSETKNSLDTSHGYYKKFSIHNGNLRKQMGLYKVENIDNPNVCTIVVNPKEYFEKFRNKSINKKHKGVIKDTKECASKITLTEYEKQIKNLNKKKMIQKGFQVKNTEMKMTAVNKVQFASLNNKRYYSLNGITSLP